MDTLKQLFSSNRQLYRDITQLQFAYRRFKSAFETFGKHLAECSVDPQFFSEIVKVDLSGISEQRIALTVFGAAQLYIAFDVIRSGAEIRGELVCSYLPASHRVHAEPRLLEIARWRFYESGLTDIELSGGGLEMTEPKEAIALATGLILIAHSTQSPMAGRQAEVK